MASNPFLPELKLFDPDIDLAVDGADPKRVVKSGPSKSPFADLLDESFDREEKSNTGSPDHPGSGKPIRSQRAQSESGLEIVEDFDGQVIDI